MIILYFVIGFVLDVLGTLDVQCVIDKKPIRSAVLAFIITLIYIFVLSQIILSPDMIENALSYALGGAVGSYFTVKRRRS